MIYICTCVCYIFYSDNRRILLFYVSYIAITQKYDVTNYTGNMMIVLLDDKTKDIQMHFQIALVQNITMRYI
jgi:hypothetical protein